MKSQAKQKNKKNWKIGKIRRTMLLPMIKAQYKQSFTVKIVFFSFSLTFHKAKDKANEFTNWTCSKKM